MDCTGDIGYDSDCFPFYSKYRAIYGNILQSHMLRLPLEPIKYPEGYAEGAVDGVSNYLGTGYHQLEGNNILSFAKQDGVYNTKNCIFYSNINKDFNDGRIRAE